MSHTRTRLIHFCQVCGAESAVLRRGRCSACYIRWADERPVGLGASCVVCAERRRDYLHVVEFQRRWLPMCFTCSARGFRLHPVPENLELLIAELRRDRRCTSRRLGGRDRRIFQVERRADDRRVCRAVEDEQYIDASDLIIEVLLDDEIPGELTRIADGFTSLKNDGSFSPI